MLVGILRGSLCFLADLSRAVHLPAYVDCLGLRSYVGTEGGQPRVTADLVEDIAGADVVVVEDIVERGTTLAMALDVLRRMQPGSLAVCTLLRKPAAASVPIPELRYVGFEIADEFVVGYGLDFNGRYRNLPAIRVLDPAEARAAGG